jgi:hypothetical protein
MNNKYLIIFLILFLILFLINFFNKQFSCFNNIKHNFNKKSFLEEINNYNNVIICGNSPKFNSSFNKIENPNESFIIRFNSVLEHLPENSKTDVLFISKDIYDNYDKNKINKWTNKTKVYLVDDLLLSDFIFTKYPMNLTSGLSVLIFLVNYIDPKKIKVVGFDMVNNHNESANWYGKNVVWDGHNINTEKDLLNEIILKNNITKY